MTRRKTPRVRKPRKEAWYAQKKREDAEKAKEAREKGEEVQPLPAVSRQEALRRLDQFRNGWDQYGRPVRPKESFGSRKQAAFTLSLENRLEGTHRIRSVLLTTTDPSAFRPGILFRAIARRSTREVNGEEVVEYIDSIRRWDALVFPTSVDTDEGFWVPMGEVSVEEVRAVLNACRVEGVDQVVQDFLFLPNREAGEE